MMAELLRQSAQHAKTISLRLVNTFVLGRPDRVIDSEGEEIESPSGVRRDSPCELIYRGLSAEIDLIAQWNGTTMGFAFLPKDPN